MLQGNSLCDMRSWVSSPHSLFLSLTGTQILSGLVLIVSDIFGAKCDHPDDHESDHTYPDTHTSADQGSNPCSLGSPKRGGRERSRGADTMVQTSLLGARSHILYTSACSNAGWEAPPGERSSLHCRVVLPLCFSHCIVMVMGLLQTRNDTLFFHY